jgi:hypothetical protein
VKLPFKPLKLGKLTVTPAQQAAGLVGGGLGLFTLSRRNKAGGTKPAAKGTTTITAAPFSSSGTDLYDYLDKRIASLQQTGSLGNGVPGPTDYTDPGTVTRTPTTNPTGDPAPLPALFVPAQSSAVTIAQAAGYSPTAAAGNSAYGPGGYFGNGDQQGQSNAWLAKGYGATINGGSTPPKADVVNAVGGALPNGTINAGLAAIFSAATAEQRSSKEFVSTWNAINGELGGTAVAVPVAPPQQPAPYIPVVSVQPDAVTISTGSGEVPNWAYSGAGASASTAPSASTGSAGVATSVRSNGRGD